MNRHQCHPQYKEDGEWGQAEEEIRVQLQTVKFLCDFWVLNLRVSSDEGLEKSDEQSEKSQKSSEF